MHDPGNAQTCNQSYPHANWSKIEMKTQQVGQEVNRYRNKPERLPKKGPWYLLDRVGHLMPRPAYRQITEILQPYIITGLPVSGHFPQKCKIPQYDFRY